MEMLLQPLFFFLLLFLCSSCGGAAIDCMGSKIVHTIIVDQQGKGDFRTVQAAIDSINENNYQWVKIHINPGKYMEKVIISQEKGCIFLEGQGKEITTVTSSGYHSAAMVTSKFQLNNRLGATFVSLPSNVIVIGITFENSYNLVGSEPIQPAPAAAIYGDKSVFYECGFVSYQDTLFDAMNRHYFKDCYIKGEVDFIYGNGQSYYEDCTINATLGNSPPGYVTAQSRQSKDDESGFVFRGGGVIGNGEVHLGRAYGPYSRVIFYETYLSSVVSPKGWDAWDYPGLESRFTYAEVDCTGAGANTTGRVKWEKKLPNWQLKKFSLSSFINKDRWLSYLPVKF